MISKLQFLTKFKSLCLLTEQTCFSIFYLPGQNIEGRDARQTVGARNTLFCLLRQEAQEVTLCVRDIFDFLTQYSVEAENTSSC